MPLHYVYLVLAVVTETVGTVSLQASHQLSRPWPSALAGVSYAASFYLLAVTLEYMAVGIVYAIWAGLGIVFIAMIGWMMFGQKLDAPAAVGILLIVAGIITIYLFSDTATHSNVGSSP